MINFKCNKRFFIIFFSILSLKTLYSQSGIWVPKNIDQSMSGVWLYDPGETVVMATREFSRYIYFFDINSSQWTVVDCKTTQNFKRYSVQGHVAMVYSDTILVGYSGLTSKWDTVYYKGKVLDPNPSYGDRSYGCGNYLAYFVTDKCIYVFDSELGKWQSHEYGLSFSYQSGNGRFWSRDDYVGIIIDNPTGYDYNCAYSIHTHSFAELTEGGFYEDKYWEFNHGFVAQWTNYSIYKFIGYSAFSNRFDVLLLNKAPLCGQNSPSYIVKNLNLKTVYALHQIENLDNILYRLHIYGYDTRNGNWNHHTWDYADSLWSIGCVSIGGQFATVTVNSDVSKKVNYWIYSGINNNFNWIITDLSSGFGGPTSPYGGIVIANRDDSNLWIYSILKNINHLIPLSGKDYLTSAVSDSFGVFILKDLSNQDSVYLNIYHETRDDLIKLTIPKISGTISQNPYLVVAQTAGANREVFCYSGVVNNYKILEFSSDALITNFLVGKIFASMAVGNTFYFYNGKNNEYYSIPNSLFYQAYSVGDNVILVKSGTNKFYTYSTIINNLEEKVISEDLSGLISGNYVGLLTTPVFANKCYAYNGFYGSIVPLNLTGSFGASSKVGGSTIIVIRTDAIYAFNPQRPTGIDQKDVVNIPTMIKLYQNYPNPFNPSTKIKFDFKSDLISNNKFLVLKIYDLLGREVKSIVKEVRTAGSYEFEWDGTDQLGNRVASGVYVYRISVSDEQDNSMRIISSRKMILMR